MKSLEKDPTIAQAARRRLVRGAFAAPAVLTVYSGSAIANGSAMRCLVNQTSSPTIPAVKDVTALDGYLRIKLKKTGSSSSLKYWVHGSDLQPYKKTRNGVYLTSNQWQEFDIGTNKAVGGVRTEPSNHSPSSKYAVVRFDAAGNVMGVGIGQASGQSAIAHTCWSSLAVSL